jgi:chemotaxis protein CheZ
MTDNHGGAEITGNSYKEKISAMIDDKLSSKELEKLISCLKQTMDNDPDFDDEVFFRDIAYEMTGQVKELASLIIDFKKEMKSKIHPALTDIAVKYIPEAADQLETIIDSTEAAANKIMDNLEGMQGDVDALRKIIDSFRKEAIQEEKGDNHGDDRIADSQREKDISAVIDLIKPYIDNSMTLISDSFIQMSFQDLTGQRIKRIINLVNQMEERIRNMVISFGIKLTEKEKNPSISSNELRRAVEEKVTELAGPQKEGKGLDQAGIDELLANL